MSPTPQNLSRPHPAANPGGDGVKLNVVAARGAQRTGAIWILVISLTLAVIVLGAFWLSQSAKMQAVNHPSGRDLNTQDVHKLYPPSAEEPAQPAKSKPAGGV